MHYERLIREALQTPWALSPEMVAVVWDLLRFRATGGRLSAEEIRARIGDDRPAPTAQQKGLVAVIPVWGVIAHRTFEASSGMTSTELIGRMFQRALADDEVSAILLDVSSPGGTVEGVPELANLVFEARKAKPITAISNALMASAAFWIGTQAHEVVVTPSGEVGSVGVYSLHEDWSGWLNKEGIKITALTAGERKTEGAPWEPLSDDAKAYFQTRVDETYRDFIAAVARGRGVSVAEVLSTYGQGRIVSAKEAVRLGMADRIATFDEAVMRLSSTRTRPRTTATAAATVGVPIVLTARESADAVEEIAALDIAGQQTDDAGEADQQAEADRDALETILPLAE